MSKKITAEDAALKVKQEDPMYELISYTLAKEPMTLKHLICGEIYTIKRAREFLSSHEGRCPKCLAKKPRSKRISYNSENIASYIDSDRPNNEYTYISGFVNMRTKAKIKHNICGNILEIEPSSFLGKRKRGCSICANAKRGKRAADSYLEDILNNAPDGKEYKWVDSNYLGDNKIKMELYHSKCKKTYMVRPNDFQQGYRCPNCVFGGVSKEEESLADFIEEILPDTEIIRNYRDRFEIDIYIPSMNIGFEYNGTFWHSDKNKDKNYHLNKLNYFKDRDIEIYFIEGVDWMKKTEIVQDRIRSIVKRNRTVYARKLSIKKCSREEEKDFLNKNHIQGYAISSFAIGLYDDCNLISLMSFVKCRKNTNTVGDDKMELLRFSTVLGTNVVGGFSKLLKYSESYIFENYKGINKIMSYADISLSRGNVYEKCGFELDHISKPSYYYSLNNHKYNRYSFRKSELKKKYPDYYDINKTEFQITDSIPNLLRVWNCGNLVYLKDL